MGDEPRTFAQVLADAETLARTDPAALTDVHLQHLSSYVSTRELAAIRQRREAAILARDAAVRQRADQAFATQQQRVAEAAAAASDVELVVKTAALDPLATLQELAAQYPDEPTPLSAFTTLYTFVQDMNARNVERNGKIAALEQRAAAAETRLLELEAQKAIADVKA